MIALVLIPVYALITTFFVYQKVFLPYARKRVDFMAKVLRFEGVEAPYSYRLLVPMLIKLVSKVLWFKDAPLKHVMASCVVLYVASLTMFGSFYLILDYFTSPFNAVLGISILQAVIPLTITGFLITGDIVNAAIVFSGLSLVLILDNPLIALIVLCLVGVCNRFQILLLPILAFVLRPELLASSGVILLMATGLIGILMALSNAAPQRNTTKDHLKGNFNPTKLGFVTIPLWLAVVLPLAVLAILNSAHWNGFVTKSMILMVPYTIVFFCRAFVWELAKYLPAIMIFILALLIGG